VKEDHFMLMYNNGKCLVSIHAPLNESTTHMINTEALNQMKRGAMLINTSRGPLVDAKALVNCLKSGKLRGAALDVYEFEGKYFCHDFSQQVNAGPLISNAEKTKPSSRSWMMIHWHF
jgi:lactate dehydrogenase-like 2-hydroxyacid dehydrogenase